VNHKIDGTRSRPAAALIALIGLLMGALVALPTRTRAQRRSPTIIGLLKRLDVLLTSIIGVLPWQARSVFLNLGRRQVGYR